jgi:hypothetical protein
MPDPGLTPTMEAAMGEYETDAVPMDELRANVKAIQTISARVGTEALRAAALDAREQLTQSLGPLPERIAALDLQLGARLGELKKTPKPTTEPQAASDPACTMAWAIATGCLQLADEADAAGDADAASFYAGQGYHYLGIALDCEEGGSPSG